MASILIVDDDPDSRRLTQGQLESGGHRVSVSDDAVDAMVTVQAKLPEVIVCDLRRADLGWRVLGEIKSHPELAVSDIPVLVVSADGTENDRIRAAIDGAIGHLVKPVLADDLRAAVAGALDNGPDAVQRRHARVAALEQMARHETGNAIESVARVHLTRLERTREVEHDRVDRGARALDLTTLTEKQRRLLAALHVASSVSDAAASLEVSRSNVYASLRRISRKLDIGSVQALLHLVRTGQLGS